MNTGFKGKANPLLISVPDNDIHSATHYMYTFVHVIFFYVLQAGNVISMDDMDIGLNIPRLFWLEEQKVM